MNRNHSTMIQTTIDRVIAMAFRDEVFADAVRAHLRRSDDSVDD